MCEKIKLDVPIDYNEPYCNFDKEEFSEEKTSENNLCLDVAKAVVGAVVTKSLRITKSF